MTIIQHRDCGDEQEGDMSDEQEGDMSDEQAAVELKPCPFCGSDARGIEWDGVKEE